MGRCVMGIPLNSILNLTEEQLENSKIELNITRVEAGVSYIDHWTGCSDEEKRAGDRRVTCYCGWPAGKKHNFYEGQWVFSFIQLSDNRDRWLFVSAAKALSVPEGGPTEVEVLTEYAPLFGRLIINYHKPQGHQLYIYHLKTVLDNATVEEILPDLYYGEAFHGYDDVHLPYIKIDRIFRREIMPSYHDALESVTGIYCLTDTKTGKLYIGSATGEGGVAARWGSYLDTKHGGNKKLRELYEREGEEYFRENFEFTLLEWFGMSYDPDKVRNREQWWKRCLRTREHGYNDN